MSTVTGHLAPPAELPAPGPRRAPRTRTVFVVAVVAFVAAALSATLYVTADADHDAAAAVLAEREAELADVRADVLATDAERALAERRNAGLEEDNTALTGCVDAVRHYLWDGLTGAARDSALDAMFEACQ
jgi:hypothetical protein